jgi:hypothetical protein
MSMSISLAGVRVIDPILSTVARGFAAQQFIARQLLPNVPVPAAGGQIIQFGREEFRQYNNTRRAPGAATVRLPMGYAGAPYALSQFAIEVPVPREHMRDASRVPGINLGTIATQKGMRNGMLDLEVEAAALVRNTASYAASNRVALAGGSRFSDAAVDPFVALETGKEAIRAQIGLYPNTVAMGARVFAALKRNQAVLDRIKYTGTGQVTTQILADLLEVEQVLIGQGIQLDAADAATDIWGTDLIMAYTGIGAVDNAQPSFGFTYELEGHPLVEVPYWDASTKSWIYPVSYERVPVVAGNTAGYLIQTAAA